MTSDERPLEKDENIDNCIEIDLTKAKTSKKVLRAREYYEKKHPWFGSQIHYTIDVFRQLIRDSRVRKQNSSRHGS